MFYKKSKKVSLFKKSQGSTGSRPLFIEILEESYDLRSAKERGQTQKRVQRFPQLQQDVQRIYLLRQELGIAKALNDDRKEVLYQKIMAQVKQRGVARETNSERFGTLWNRFFLVPAFSKAALGALFLLFALFFAGKFLFWGDAQEGNLNSGGAFLISSLYGDVKILQCQDLSCSRTGMPETISARTNHPVRLQANRDQFALVSLDQEHRLLLSPGTVVDLLALPSKNKKRVRLFQGMAYLAIENRNQERKILYEFGSDSTFVHVRGTRVAFWHGEMGEKMVLPQGQVGLYISKVPRKSALANGFVKQHSEIGAFYSRNTTSPARFIVTARSISLQEKIPIEESMILQKMEQAVWTDKDQLRGQIFASLEKSVRSTDAFWTLLDTAREGINNTKMLHSAPPKRPVPATKSHSSEKADGVTPDNERKLQSQPAKPTVGRFQFYPPRVAD